MAKLRLCLAYCKKKKKKFHINLVEGKIRVNINKKNAVSYSKLENIPSSVYKS